MTYLLLFDFIVLFPISGLISTYSLFTKGKIPPRVVDINAGTAQNYYNYIAHYVTPEDYEAVKALGIENPEAYDFKKILEW